MTEQAELQQDVPQAPQAQPQQPPSQADLELQERITAHLQDKAKLLNELVQLYSHFTQTVSQFDIPVHIKAVGLQHFDTGFLWIKEAIQVKPIPAKVEAPSAPAEASIDAA